mgnify:FL=1
MDSFKYHLIRQRREKLGLTQLDLAFVLRQLGQEIHPSTIHTWETGETAPDADKIPTLAKALQMPTEEFYG